MEASAFDVTALFCKRLLHRHRREFLTSRRHLTTPMLDKLVVNVIWFADKLKITAALRQRAHFRRLLMHFPVTPAANHDLLLLIRQTNSTSAFALVVSSVLLPLAWMLAS